MSHERVTVGMLVRGDLDGIRRAIPAVAGQTWQGTMRVVVFDDGTVSGSKDVLADLSDAYGNVIVETRPSRLDSAALLNEIADIAGDDYLTWIDPGWMWRPRAVERQVSALRRMEWRFPDQRLLSVASWRTVLGARVVTHRPSVDGDQLGAILTGELDAPLTVMLARAQYFRDVGFDTSLPARFNSDFLFRFVSTGGRIVNSSRDLPLATRVEETEDAQDVISAGKVLYQRHKPELARRPVRDRRNARAAIYRGASAGGPVAAASNAVERLRRGEIRDEVRRRSRRLLSAAAPAMRRLGVVELARKSGLTRRLRVRSVARLRTAGMHIDARKSLRPVDVRAQIVSVNENDHAECLRLERSFRGDGLLHSAELVLRKGLGAQPRHPDLRVRLLELLALRKKSDEALKMWADRSDEEARHFQPVTYARIARVLRDVGDDAEALSVAEDGARRWPDDSLVQAEVLISKAACGDWQARLETDRAATAPGESAGAVESRGFLVGEPKPLTGVVPGPLDQDVDVTLHVNDVGVVTTKPRPRVTDAEFSLRCDEMLQYLGDGDVVSVTSNGTTLRYGAGDARWTVSGTGSASRAGDLHKRIDAGHVFTKFGALKPRHTEESRIAALELFGEVASVVNGAVGAQAYPFYGNLLGAIREHDFIAHDIGGFDMAYLSSHSEPDAVCSEFVDVCAALIRRGYFVRLQPWSGFVRPTYRSRLHVDLNYAWFTDDGLHVSGGSRFQRARARNSFVRSRTTVIGGQEVVVPGNSEEVLVQLYGPSWHIADQGFDVADELRLDEEYLLSPEAMDRLERLDPDRVQVQRPK